MPAAPLPGMIDATQAPEAKRLPDAVRAGIGWA